ARSDLAHGPGHDASLAAAQARLREVVQHFLDVWSLTPVVESEPPAETRDRRGRARAQRPACDVEVVRAPVRHLAARVAPEPAEVVDAAEGVEGNVGRGPEPHVPVQLRGEPAAQLARGEA